MLDLNLPSAISRTNLEYAWHYQDQEGRPLLITCRYKCPKKGKRFIPYHMNEAGSWEVGAGKQPYPLFGLSLFRYYDISNIVYITEGERAARALQYYCCATLLVVFGSLIGRKRQIRPEKKNPKWVITPNFWGFIVGRSGLLKTPAMKQVLSELDDLIQITMKKHQQDMQEYEWQKENAKSNKLPLPSLPILKRYKIEDPTIEALGPILRDNPQGVLLSRDELQGWLKSMNKKGQENARAFYLETWNASANFTSDRIGRGMIHIPFMCLSVFGGIQPGPIASYVSGMRSGDDNDDGFLQRFQIMVWPNSIPWKPYNGALDEELERDIKGIYRWLDQLAFDKDGNPIILEFSDEAQKLFDEWQAIIQPRIRSDEMPDYMASHLSKYPKLLPSIALIIELVNGAIYQSHPKSVSVESFLIAKKWCEYLEPHAWKVYHCDQVSIIENAKKLISKVQAGKLPDGFTVREVHHSKHWSGLADSTQVQKACDYAEGKKWLIKKPMQTGGRQTDRYYLHPQLKDLQV